MLLRRNKIALSHQGAKPAFPVLLVHTVNRSGWIGPRDGPDHAFKMVELPIG